MFNRQYLTEIRLFSCCERNLILRLDGDSTFVGGSDSVTLIGGAKIPAAVRDCPIKRDPGVYRAISTCFGGCLATVLCQTPSLIR